MQPEELKIDLTAKRDAECVPIALAIIKMVAEQPDLMLGTHSLEEQQAYYRKFLQEKIMPFFLENNIRTADIVYIGALTRQAFDNIINYGQESMEVAEDNAVALKFGLSAPNEMRLSHLVDAQMEASKRIDPKDLGVKDPQIPPSAPVN